MLVGTLFVIMYLGQCTFQLVEYRFGGRLINIFDCFYFVVVTLSTVGYGDISPSTKGGQVVVICLILTALTVLPSLISALLATIEETKKGNGGVFTRGQASYFVVLGHFDMAFKINEVLGSILHAHSTDEKVVILGRSPANHLVQAAITAYQYKDRVTYLVGNGMDKHDLERAQISHATAVYIIPDRGAPDHRKEDEKNTLRTWAIHTYAPDVPLFVNNLLPDTESYQEMNADASLCIDDLKQLVLALTVMYDGASAFLINLLHVSAPDSKYNTLWESQYGDGFGNEMFSVPMNPNFVGMLFNEASWLTFREFQDMIGVRVYSKLTGLKTLVLNPGSTYKLALEDEVVFLAQEIADIDRFLNMTPTEYQTLVSRSNPKFSSNDTVSNVTPSTPYYGTLQRHSISLPRLKSTLKPISHRLASIADFGESCIVMDIPEAPYEVSNVPQCRLRVLPPSFEEQIVESASDWSGHLLICTGDYDVFKFVCGLRAAHLEKHHKILFLAARAPTKAEYSTLSVFPDIHYMVGDPSQKKVLLSAGLRGCHRVILMKFGIYSSGDFAGSAAIMISHLIYHMFQRGEIEQEKCVILEATKRPLINYLHPTPTATQVSYRRLFRSAFKNVGKSVGINKTLDGGHRRKEKNVPGEVSYFYTPVFAAGRVVAASMLDSVLFQLYKNPSLLETFLMLCGVDKQGKNESPEIMGVKKSWIGQIPLPPGFVNRTYGELYQELALNQGIIPMGLYRQVYPTLRNKLPYVFTNPLSVVLLMEGDIVFVLAP
ncbi:hypothetical protein BCR33DRAFT_520637 [Rhizoclosmatium globosum]|uniref:Calcium-activated potassium channel BK alpha subunit domain-containing protein n=1 Tax=Rhizoclosmatium globosum TaxID=329046 RepID=A0A1Y2BFE2_9FUNG|nr:hypothetical protein BCR33DRAFT_520637 [Rhizoclosmatium globosum]|eukprot:ORY33197.1 hypothetical protein BCR33DRAFT_520637 [Rhizoclosmatium globosum]